MTFTALDLLACVVAALLSSHAGRLYRLRIDGSGAGLRISSGAHPKPLSEDGVKPFPCAIYAPDSEVMMDRFPGWEIAGQKSPDAATTEDVENGVQDLSGVMELWPAGILRDWEVGLEHDPLCIGSVGGVSFSHARYFTELLLQYPFSDSL